MPEPRTYKMVIDTTPCGGLCTIRRRLRTDEYYRSEVPSGKKTWADTPIYVQVKEATVVVQQDLEYPMWATLFGWNIRNVQLPGQTCDHRGTDGTIDCPDCGCPVTDFITAAGEYLTSNHGKKADDPGIEFPFVD